VGRAGLQSVWGSNQELSIIEESYVVGPEAYIPLPF